MAQPRYAITLWRKSEQLLRTVMDGRRQESRDFQRVGHLVLSLGAQVRPGIEQRIFQAFLHCVCEHFQHLQLEIRDVDQLEIVVIWSVWPKTSTGGSPDKDSEKEKKYIGIYWSQERFQRFSFNLALRKCVIRFNDCVSMQEITSWRTQTPAFCVLISFWGALFVTRLLEEQLCATARHCGQLPVDMHSVKNWTVYSLLCATHN